MSKDMTADDVLEQTKQYLKHVSHQGSWRLNLETLPQESLATPQEPLEPDMQGSPQHQSEAAKKLHELYLEVKDTPLCDLAKTCQNFVFGEGLATSPLMIIGEGPGAEEDKQGRPFVGLSGQLLGKLLHTIGIDRADVYITNIVKYRPPNNRNPNQQEIQACFGLLNQQIEIINPKLIMILGNVALQTLLPQAPAGITKARGQLWTYQQWQVLPSFHPAYLLRNPAAIEIAWSDFKYAASLIFDMTETEKLYLSPKTQLQQ